MTLQVIGAGFGRTGTLSMKAALEELGYIKTHHMLEVLPNSAQRKLWCDVGEGHTPNWDAIFDGYQASVDFPSSTYYKELLAKYPEAKVVLTVREANAWYKSARDTIYALSNAPPRWAERIIPLLSQNRTIVDGTVWNRVFDGRFEDEAYAKQVFTDYIEQVKRDIPADKLLVFQVKEGWAPLCAFLGVDAPTTPFPHVNDSASFRKMITRVKLGFSVFYALCAGLLAWLAYIALA